MHGSSELCIRLFLLFTWVHIVVSDISNIKNYIDKRLPLKIYPERFENVYIAKDSTRNLESPKNENGYDYPPNVLSNTNLYTDPGYKINITFTRFELEEPHDGNCLDYLLLYDKDGDILLGPICGHQIPGPVTSFDNAITIVFHTDEDVNRFGYQILLFSGNGLTSTQPITSTVPAPTEEPILATADGEICDLVPATLYARSHSERLSPPWFDGHSDYPGNIDCRWIIVASDGEVVHMKFNILNVEFHATCNYDFVDIINGDETNAKSLGKFCGRATPEGSIISTKSAVTVRFKSDYNVGGTGFQLDFFQAPKICRARDFMCDANVSSINCVEYDELCDGITDCRTGADEKVCDEELSCGRPIIKSKDYRIVGGEEAVHHSWPWTASVMKSEDGNFGHICGGTLISHQWIITAAHCVHGHVHQPYRFKVTLGIHRLSDAVTDRSPSIEIDEIVESQYNPGTRINDVALLRLATPVSFHPGILPACVATSYKLSDSVPLVTVGWGSTEDASLSNVLNQVKVPYIPRSICNGEDWYDGKIAPDMICAGYEWGQKDSCQGDSGGPLILYDHKADRYILVGLVSWGSECGAARKPGVYTNVMSHASWISQVTGVSPLLFENSTTHSVASVAPVAESVNVDPCENGPKILQATDVNEILSSPAYDGVHHYGINLDCSWLIKASTDRNVKVKLTHFHLEEDGIKCRYDYLALYNASESMYRIGKFCGNTLPKEMFSYGNELLLKFHSDEVVSAKGFQLQYSQVPKICRTDLGDFQCSDQRTCVPFSVLCKSTKAFCPQNDDVDACKNLGCGRSVIPPKGLRIVGGNEAVPHSFPWTVALMYYQDHICGGTLINNDWILTAAHCVEHDTSVVNYRVMLGRHDISLEADEPDSVVRTIDQIKQHPGYNVNMEHDVALLHLESPVIYSAAVRPVCLPSETSLTEENELLAVGWGETQGTIDGNEGHLNQVTVKYISNTKCREWYNKLKEIKSNMICAGYEAGGKDSCKGDSGGPLMYFKKSDDRFYIVGITSFGVGCAKARYPGVYARVTSHLAWIHEIIAES